MPQNSVVMVTKRNYCVSILLPPPQETFCEYQYCLAPIPHESHSTIGLSHASRKQ